MRNAYAGLLLAILLAACSRSAAPEQPPARIAFDRVSASDVEHGKRLVSVLGCTGCHGDDLYGKDWGDLEYGTLWTANLTRSAAAHDKAELLAMSANGSRPDRALIDMPSYLFTQLDESDIEAVVAYLKTTEPGGNIHPDPTIGPKLAEEIASGEFRDSRQRVIDEGGQWPPDLGAQFALGRYIVRATCVECHKMDLRGDNPATEEPPLSVDLRMVASYDQADFAKFMKTGEAAGGRELVLMSGVARRRYSQFTEREREAVRAYLVELAAKEP